MSLFAGISVPDRLHRPALLLATLVALVGLFGAGLFAPPASAADPVHDVYTVAGVPVDATAASSPVARDQAIAMGERRAVRLLLERLALRRDYPRLPQVAPTDLQALIEGFEVSGERTSAVRYQADLTVAFKPAAVRALMAQAGIPIAETPSRPVLVLPLWRGPQGLRLFDETNPWRDAWIRIATGKGLVPLTTPLGDVADLAAITPDQAASGNAAALAAIAKRYNVGEVIVALASSDAKGENIDQLSVTRYTLNGERSTVNVSPRRPPEALLATALAISQEVEESWKMGLVGNAPSAPGAVWPSNGPSNGPNGPANGPNGPVAGSPTWPGDGTAPPGGDGGLNLTVRVPVHQLSEWLAIRKKLGDVSLVKKVEVSSLGVDGASIILSYVGGEQQLQAALAQSDLALSNDGGTWVLRAKFVAGPPATSPPAPSPPSGAAPPPAGAVPSGAAPPVSPGPPGPPGPVGTAAPASVPPSTVPPVAVPVSIGPAPGVVAPNSPAR